MGIARRRVRTHRVLSEVRWQNAQPEQPRPRPPKQGQRCLQVFEYLTGVAQVHLWSGIPFVSPTKGDLCHNRTHRCASFTSTRRFCHNLPVCGRYKLSRRKQIVEEYFDTASGEEDWSPRYNVAPTQPVPVIRQHPKEPVRELSLMRWGLILSWSKDSSVAASMINARSETAATKPAFRDALKSRRCLIPADGFYEWRRTGKTEQPYCFEVNEGELFAFAGIWDRWKNPSGNWMKTSSILTTTPNAVTSAFPNRSPASHPMSCGTCLAKLTSL
jgi:putative SOS response-associated peptidase YedK